MYLNFNINVINDIKITVYLQIYQLLIQVNYYLLYNILRKNSPEMLKNKSVRML